MENAAESGFLNAMAAPPISRIAEFLFAAPTTSSAKRSGVLLIRDANSMASHLEELRQLSPAFAEDFYSSITLAATVDCHDVIGGTRPRAGS